MQQVQAGILAFFRMELRAKYVGFVHDACDVSLAKHGGACNIEWVVTFEMKTVYVIKGKRLLQLS